MNMPELSLRNPAIPVALTALLLACSAGNGDRRLRVGEEPGASGGNGQAGSGGSGRTRDGGVTGTWQALSVQVEDIEGMTIELVTLECAGDCAEVEAVAHGGNPPYNFQWDDGSTEPRRVVCPASNTTLTVSGTDTAIDTDEFKYEAQTASADVTATVFDCSDAGTSTPPETCESGALIANPSFEGVERTNVSGADFDAPSWQPCDLTPDVTGEGDAAGTGGQIPSDGKTYIYLGVASFIGSESIGQQLCSPLRAGTTHHFSVDIIATVPFAPGAALQVFGGSSACTHDALLASSASVMPTTVWSTVCLTLTPQADHEFITLAMDPTLGGGLIDNLVEVDACP
jgi:hypothetical protein